MPALDGISLDLEKGEILGLVGANGAGKSTLLKIVSGNLSPDQGEMAVSGQSVRISSPDDARRAGIATVHQELVAVPEFTVGESIHLHREPTRGGLIDHKRLYAKTQELLSSLGFTEVNPFDQMGALSPSQKQLVQIARALAEKALILIMDEPTSSLTASEAERLLSIFRKLRSGGVTVVFVSHRLEEVLSVADRVVVLRDGRVAGSCRASEPDAMNTIVRLMVGASIGEFYPKRSGKASGEVALRVEGLRLTSSSPGISFEVKRGEILGLYGLVGSGRTDVVEALFGLRRAHSGHIAVLGRPSDIRSPGHALRLGVGLVPEDRRRDGLILLASILQNVSLPGLGNYCKAGFIGKRKETSAVVSLLSQVNAKYASLRQPAESLSGGNQQKALLAKWLQLRLSVLILDEPTKGIDVNSKVEIYRLVNGLADSGIATIFVSSEAEECHELCDRVLVFKGGRVVAEVRPDATSVTELVEIALSGEERDRASAS